MLSAHSRSSLEIVNLDTRTLALHTCFVQSRWFRKFKVVGVELHIVVKHTQTCSEVLVQQIRRAIW